MELIKHENPKYGFFIGYNPDPKKIEKTPQPVWQPKKEKAFCDAVVIPAEGFIQLEYLLCKAMERIKQHKEELAKQNVPEREINLTYEKNEIFAHDYIELFRMFISTGGPHDEYIIKRKEE